MKLLAVQHVGSRKIYKIILAADGGGEHPIAGGKPEWKIVEHRGHDGSKSVRPLAEIAPATDGHSATIHALSFPGVIEIEVTADALLPIPSGSAAMLRTKKMTSTIMVVIPEIPDLAAGLDLRIVPDGCHDFFAAE